MRGRVDIFHMVFRNDKGMPVIERINVHESVSEIVFIQFESWYLAPDDLAEDAILNQVYLGHDCFLLALPLVNAAADRI